MAQIKIPTLTCLRCGHRWVPRGPRVAKCSRCKSRLWNEPKGSAKAKRSPTE